MRGFPRILVLLALSTTATVAHAAPPVAVELLTVGRGEDLYAAFGHTALLVLEDEEPRWVYNFGYANFNQPNMVLRFLRGEAVFYVARQSYRSMKQDCKEEDRSLWRQALALKPDQHRALGQRLEQHILPENKSYRYHHYWNNCATKPRDLIDQALNGKVTRLLGGRPASGTLREITHWGFAGHPAVLFFMDFILGRPGDRAITLKEEAFLPSSLSWSLQRVNLAGEPLEVVPREGPSLDGNDPYLGMKIQYGGAAAAVALALALAFLLRRKQGPWAGAILILLALPAALLGLFAHGLAAITHLPELRQNELIFSYWPTDLFLLWPALRWISGRLWAGGALRLYALVRLTAMGWVLVGHLSGGLYQRPLALLVLPAALALGLWFGLRGIAKSGE